MFWFGDSKWGWRYNLKKYPGEIIQGLVDNIPLCCTLYYTIVKTICLLIHGPRLWKTQEECDAEGPTKDAFIFTMFYDLQKQKDGTYISKDFNDFDYFRCPICRIVDRTEKIDWTRGSKWDRLVLKKLIRKHSF